MLCASGLYSSLKWESCVVLIWRHLITLTHTVIVYVCGCVSLKQWNSVSSFCVCVFVCIYVNLKTIKESLQKTVRLFLSQWVFPHLFDGWLDLFLLPSNSDLNPATSNAKDLNLLWDHILLMLNSHCLWWEKQTMQRSYHAEMNEEFDTKQTARGYDQPFFSLLLLKSV